MIEVDQTTGRLNLHEHNPDECLILYGSYARGDFNAASDVDILRVANERAFREARDESVTLHTYALDDLLELARHGSLFVLHILQEGTPLNDPAGVMRLLASTFRRPDSYTENTRQRLRHALRLLDVERAVFESAPHEFTATASFVCRSLLYAEHAERGAFSFSLRTLAKEDETASLLLATKQTATTFEHFRRLRQVVRASYKERSQGPLCSSLSELAGMSDGDKVFEGLLRRILGRVGADPYDTVSSFSAELPRATRGLAP